MTSWGGHSYTQCLEEETGAQRGQVTCRGRTAMGRVSRLLDGEGHSPWGFAGSDWEMYSGNADPWGRFPALSF